MTHVAAHAAAATGGSPGTIHGYVTAHLTDPSKTAQARTAVGGVPHVVSTAILDGAIIAFVELPAPAHSPIPPADAAAHKRLTAVADQIGRLPPGTASFFDWVIHT